MTIASGSFFSFIPALAAFNYTPLIQSSYFDGVTTDLLTTVGGVITLIFIILGLGVLYRVLK